MWRSPEEVAESAADAGAGAAASAALAGVVGLVVGTRRRVGVAGGVGVEDGMDGECRWLLVDCGGGERGGRLRGRRCQPTLEVGKDVGGQLIRRQLRRGGASGCVVAGDEGLGHKAGIDAAAAAAAAVPAAAVAVGFVAGRAAVLGPPRATRCGGRADGR